MTKLFLAPKSYLLCVQRKSLVDFDIENYTSIKIFSKQRIENKLKFEITLIPYSTFPLIKFGPGYSYITGGTIPNSTPVVEIIHQQRKSPSF